MTTATAEPVPDTDTMPTGRHTHADVKPILAEVPLTLIDRSRNHRVSRPGDEQRIEALRQSISVMGQGSPVRIYRSDADYDEGDLDPKVKPYILGFGWRRCEALARLGSETVRAEIYPPAPDHEIEAARAIENIHRQDITPVEEAQAVADILAAYQADHPASSKQEAIEHAAAETGRTVSWIRDRDYFTRLSRSVRELATRVPIPAGHLREMAKVGDPQLQRDIALETVGLSPWNFKKGDTLDTGTKGFLDDFFARSAAGVVRIDTLGQVQRRVGEAQRSLKSVPWALQLPVLVKGKTALPACDGCAHNTANDLTLFGVEGEAPAHGTCMSPVCYSAKKAAAEKERDRLLSALLRLKNGPTPEKINAKVAAAPDWLDPKKLKGFLTRKTKAAPEGRSPAPSGSSPCSGGRRSPTPHEKALEKFDAAALKWVGHVADLIMQRADETPVGRAAIRLFGFSRALNNLKGLHVPTVDRWRAPQTASPKFDGAHDLPALVCELIDLIAAQTAVAACAITEVEFVSWGPVMPDEYPLHPGLYTRVFVALRGDAATLPAFPKWEDFAPKPKAAKPAAKKKASSK